jgi:deoxyguanosine kinase
MPDHLAAEPPGYVVVEGPIGVGKTSLARRLAASFGCEILLEAAEENPFLERFYNDPRQAALPAQLFFLFQRSRQISSLKQGDLFRDALVADFMLEKDRLFARLNLDADELNLCEEVYARVSLEAPAPDLVVYLQAPVDVLIKRIRRRGRKIERRLEPSYLERLSEAYVGFFGRYQASPLLIVNATTINPVDSDADYAMLLEQIVTHRSGRHHVNPEPLEF